MDYTLAALKVMCAQLKDAREMPTQNAMTLGGILFQRAWLQGILVSVSNVDSGRVMLDDGTGIIELSLSGDFLLRPWNIEAASNRLGKLTSIGTTMMYEVELSGELAPSGYYLIYVVHQDIPS